MTDQTAEAIERLKVFMGWNAKPMPADDEDFTSYVSEAINGDLATLLADRERLRLVMKPFAEAAEHLHPSQPDDGVTLDGIEVRHWRAAWAALNTQGEGE